MKRIKSFGICKLMSVNYPNLHILNNNTFVKRRSSLIFLLLFLLVDCTNARGEVLSKNDLDKSYFSNLSANEVKGGHLNKIFSYKRKLADAYYEGNNGDDDSNQETKSCMTYIYTFLDDVSDKHDRCEGMQNAYVSAYCAEESESNARAYNDDDHDDYFSKYTKTSCCGIIVKMVDEACKESDLITNGHLLLIAIVLLLCEGAKSLITTHKLYFLPEAGGCILVGVLVGLISHLTPYDIYSVSFNENIFLMVLLPPIIFEAALAVNKKEFRRRRLAILMFAILGTLISTFLTGFMVHYASVFLEFEQEFPLIDSLVFGALISSIDPVAILSVLSNLGLTEQDTIFIMVFGESLLNDGVAITLYKTLVSQYSAEQVTTDEMLGAAADFLILMVGSIIIGFLCGFMCLVYFWLLRKKLNAAMEVASFFLWAGIPYYICDSIEFSGIMGIVVMGIFMDVYIAAPKHRLMSIDSSPKRGLTSEQPPHTDYVDLGDSIPCGADTLCQPISPSSKSLYSFRSIRSFNIKELIYREERFRLSAEADKHVRFVAHLLAQLSENAIFVYLGLFLFGNKYKWDFSLVFIGVVSCILSRGIMVMILCSLIWHINIMRQHCGCHKPLSAYDSDEPQVSRTATALQDSRIQLVLVLAGLRGAVSLALVESVPIYNLVTDEGSQLKRQMKAMTSASILFTLFVFGGSAYYILRRLDIPSDNAPVKRKATTSTQNSDAHSVVQSFAKNTSINGVDGKVSAWNSSFNTIIELPEKSNAQPSSIKPDRMNVARPRPESPAFLT